MTEERKAYIREYMKKYTKAHKDKRKECCKKSYNKNRDKILEYHKKYRENNKEKLTEYKKDWREKNHDYYVLSNRVSHFYSRNYFRHFSSIKNYLTIMKLEDDSLKKSIMAKLGKGTILEDEAIILSGMVWTEEDQKELDEYWKRSKKRSSSKH